MGIKKWIDQTFPPMPTKRYGSAALYTGSSVVVAGGRKSRGSPTTKVEVLNMHTHQWFNVANLPQPLARAAAAVCDDHVYILGDSSVYECSLIPLIQSRMSFLSRLFRRTAEVWREVSSPPVTDTAYVSIRGQLLAIGGKGQNRRPTTAVRLYNSDTNSWEIISHMETPRCDCIAAVFSNDLLMVMGGCERTNVNEDNDLVEVGTVEHMR